MDHRLGGRRQVLVVLAEPAEPSQPGEGAFHDPPSWGHRERRDGRRLLAWRDPTAPPAAIATRDDLESDPVALARPGQEGAAVARIGPTLAQPWQAPPVQPLKQLDRTVTITDVGGGHVHGQEQPQRVDQQVAFAAVQLLGAVIAVPPPFSVVLTLWLSKITALGVGSRPWRRRSCSRSLARICSHRPCRCHRRQ